MQRLTSHVYAGIAVRPCASSLPSSGNLNLILFNLTKAKMRGAGAFAPLLNGLPIKNISDGLGREYSCRQGKAALRKMAGETQNPFPSHFSLWNKGVCAYLIYKPYSGDQKLVTIFWQKTIIPYSLPKSSSPPRRAHVITHIRRQICCSTSHLKRIQKVNFLYTTAHSPYHSYCPHFSDSLCFKTLCLRVSLQSSLTRILPSSLYKTPITVRRVLAPFTDPEINIQTMMGR